MGATLALLAVTVLKRRPRATLTVAALILFASVVEVRHDTAHRLFSLPLIGPTFPYWLAVFGFWFSRGSQRSCSSARWSSARFPRGPAGSGGATTIPTVMLVALGIDGPRPVYWVEAFVVTGLLAFLSWHLRIRHLT